MENEVSLKFTNYVRGDNKLEKYAEHLNMVASALNGIDKGKVNIVSEASKEIKNATVSKEKLNQKIDFGINMVGLSKLKSTMTSLSRTFSKLIVQSYSYVENINLLEVAYSNANETIEESSERIETFINQMSKVYGLDESRLTRQFGIFKQLANAMELPTETAENLSELMVKMSNDIASLYNLDLDRASNALQSALAGQVRPIRSATGADITEKTLQKTVDNLGLDTTINQLSFVEKRLIMVISLTEQLKNSQGDYGRTVESVANQVKVMHEQWDRLSRSIGNVFYPIIEKVLPYLNAVLMVLTEIFNMIASLLGFKMPEFDYSGLAGVSDSTNDIIEGMDSASASVDKLSKKMSGLRGFDKLNVISTQNSSGGSSGSVGGINPKILEAFNAQFSNYNDMLGEVKMKANKIKEDIMKWLGFEEEFDEKGNSSWIFKKVKAGTILSALGVGGLGVKGVTTILSVLKKIGFLKFPLITTLVNFFKGKGEASETLGVAGSIADSANSNASRLKIPNVSTVLKGLADVAIIIGGCTAILIAMGAIANIPEISNIVSNGIQLTKQVFWGLAEIALPLAGMSALIGIMGNFSVAQFATGLADLALVIIGTDAVITAVGGLLSIPFFQEFISTGIDSTQKIFNGLASIALPIGGIATALGIAGLAGGVGVSAILVGLADMALVIGGVEVVLVALGAINQIPGIQWLMDEGMNVLLKIAEFIGKFVGTIVAGLVEGATSMLPTLGTNLSEFMINATPFFENASMIDEGATQGVSNLASALLKLTGANILDKLTSWFAGSASLTKFGEDLAEFGPLFKKYADSVKSVDTKVVSASATAGKALAEFAKLIPNKGGLVAMLCGENSVADFGKDLATFGPYFKIYSMSIKDIDTDIVNKSASSAEALAKFSEKIPNKGGLVSLFTGDNTVSDFGKDLATFGGYFKTYADNIKNIDTDIVQTSASGASALATFADKIPNKGGLVSLFTGNNTISDFGRDLALFGQYFNAYFEGVKNINYSTISNVSKNIGELVEYAKSIKNNGLTSILKDFASMLKNSAPNIKSFYENALTNSQGISIGTAFGQGIASGIKTAIKKAKLPNIKISTTVGNISLADLKITTYKNGGMPPVGQIFVANEKGPELVSHIGGQSFVANQNQMMDLLDKKISSSQSKGTQVFNLYLDADHKIGSYTIEQLQNMAKTDGKPIMIG